MVLLKSLSFRTACLQQQLTATALKKGSEASLGVREDFSEEVSGLKLRPASSRVDGLRRGEKGECAGQRPQAVQRSGGRKAVDCED